MIDRGNVGILVVIAAMSCSMPREQSCFDWQGVVSEAMNVSAVVVDTLIVDPYDRTTHVGCFVRVSESVRIFSEGKRPDALVRERAEGLGWRMPDELAADGPDGTSFGLVKPGSRCYVLARWDGGDDGDPSHATDDYYEMDILCYRTRND